MRDFNARFNKLIKRIPTKSAPTNYKKKTFYLSSMPFCKNFPKGKIHQDRWSTTQAQNRPIESMIRMMIFI